jgi:uncharacterized protein (DUF736 family)
MAIAKEDELGGLWLRTSSAGNKFMSGRLTLNGESVEVLVFKNNHKQPNERTPDYRVYRSAPREVQPERQPQQQSVADQLDDEIQW